MAHDLVIKNGTVIDGSGSPGFDADVAIDGEKITAIGKNLGSGKKEIDAKGHVVAPGFIDSHTHMDAFVVQYPNGNPVVNYGVTSIVIGDCGASCAPVPPDTPIAPTILPSMTSGMPAPDRHRAFQSRDAQTGPASCQHVLEHLARALEQRR